MSTPVCFAPSCRNAQLRLCKKHAAKALRKKMPTCCFCKEATIDYFMLIDSTWLFLCNKRDNAHLSCFEDQYTIKAGRKLTADDFKKVPVNDVLFWAMDRGRDEEEES